MSLITILLIIALASFAHHVAKKNDKENLYAVIILSVIVFLFEPLMRMFFEIKTDDAIIPRILATVSAIYYFYWAVTQGKKEKLTVPKGHMFWIVIGVLLFAFMMFTVFAPRALSDKSIEQQVVSDASSFNQPISGIDDYAKMNSLYQKRYSTLPSHALYCLPAKKSYCSPDGCNDIPPTVFNIVGRDSNGIFIGRCDNKPCDTYEAEITESVGYLSIDTKEPHGMTFKMSKQDGAYTESVTLGTDTFVSTGFCHNAKGYE